MNPVSLVFRRWFFLSALFFVPVYVSAAIPQPPTVEASGYILINAASGHSLAEHNADEPLPPASLTKVMTDYVAAYEISQGRLSLEENLPVSVKAWRMGGSRMFIQEGTQVNVEDIIKGIVVQSGNDAAVALAEYIAGSESAFADIMNQHAQSLGMTNSNFANATGWPHPEQYSSPRDMAILTRALIENYPENYAYYKEKYFTYNGIRQPNRNLLLWQDKSVDGVKTGHTDEAGYSLISSAERDGMRLIAVVMGTKSEQARATESQKLLSYGFRNFENYSPFAEGDTVAEVDVWLGEKNRTSLALAETLNLTIPKGKRDALALEVDMDKYLRAPFKKGDVLGTLLITLEDDLIAEAPLVAQYDVEKASIFKRLWHHLILFIKGLF